MRDGATLTDISVSFDEEVTRKFDWVGKGADGFPQLEGDTEEVIGKHFVIRYRHTVSLQSVVGAIATRSAVHESLAACCQNSSVLQES